MISASTSVMTRGGALRIFPSGCRWTQTRPMSGEVANTVKPKPQYANAHDELNKLPITHWYDKWCLAKFGKYKTVDQVPKFVVHREIENARSRARVKVNLTIGLFGTIASLIVVVYCKRKTAAGEMEHLSERSIKKHANWHADAKQRREAEEAK